MSFSVKTIKVFDKNAKRLFKKYPSFKKDLLELLTVLRENPYKGVALGNNCYKVRLKITSKGKGRSAGGRLITYIRVKRSIIYLLTVYDKSEISNITDQDIRSLLRLINED